MDRGDCEIGEKNAASEDVMQETVWCMGEVTGQCAARCRHRDVVAAAAQDGPEGWGSCVHVERKPRKSQCLRRLQVWLVLAAKVILLLSSYTPLFSGQVCHGRCVSRSCNGSWAEGRTSRIVGKPAESQSKAVLPRYVPDAYEGRINFACRAKSPCVSFHPVPRWFFFQCLARANDGWLLVAWLPMRPRGARRDNIVAGEAVFEQDGR